MNEWCTHGELNTILERSRDDLDELSDARLLITGGTGFVGRWLLEALLHADQRLKLGLKPVVLTRQPHRFADHQPRLARWVEALEGDVTAIPNPGMVDAVIHAATPASADLNDRDPDIMRTIIVDGARSVLDAVAPSGAVPLLFTSSGAVYGPQPWDLESIPESFDQDDAVLDPRNAYAAGKREAEQILAAASTAGGPSLRLARLFTFVGPGLPLDAHFAVGNFIGDALARRPITISGDGLAVRSYMYPTDLIVALLAVLIRGTPNRAYNVGSPDPVSIAELASRVRDLVAPAVPVEITGLAASRLPTGAGQRYVPDCTRLHDELRAGGFVGLDDAILRTANWARARQ